MTTQTYPAAPQGLFEQLFSVRIHRNSPKTTLMALLVLTMLICLVTVFPVTWLVYQFVEPDMLPWPFNSQPNKEAERLGLVFSYAVAFVCAIAALIWLKEITWQQITEAEWAQIRLGEQQAARDEKRKECRYNRRVQIERVINGASFGYYSLAKHMNYKKVLTRTLFEYLVNKRQISEAERTKYRQCFEAEVAKRVERKRRRIRNLRRLQQLLHALAGLWRKFRHA